MLVKYTCFTVHDSADNQTASISTKVRSQLRNADELTPIKDQSCDTHKWIPDTSPTTYNAHAPLWPPLCTDMSGCIYSL